MLPYCAEQKFQEEVFNFIANSGFEYPSYILTINTPVYFIISDAVLLGEFIETGTIDAL